MATINVTTELTLTKFRIHADGTGENTWNGSAMQDKDSVSDYTADGVLTPTDTTFAGADTKVYTITIPADLPASGGATTYWLLGWNGNPAIGTALLRQQFTWDGDDVVTLETLEESGGGGGGGSSIIVPITATLTANEPPRIDLPVFQGENRTFQITFLDQDGEPSDLDGHSVTLVVSTLRDVLNFELECTVGGADDNVVSIPVLAANVPTKGTWKYQLWDETTGGVIASGGFPVAAALAPAA